MQAAKLPLRMWTYDVAREQCPTPNHLRRIARLTIDSGYNALGLYLEHRFAFECTPWAHGVGCITKTVVRELQQEFPELQLIPFINLLGHFEGFLYTETGKQFREQVFHGLQACPSNPMFRKLCESMVDEILDTFSSPLVHLGGDETKQLGDCEHCRARFEDSSEESKAKLYSEHFAPLCERVWRNGRRPALWGDMLLKHPTAADSLPRETLIFDWNYRGSIAESAARLQRWGFEVVGCPTLHTYNAAWLHIPQSEENVRQIVHDAKTLGLHGVCLTTWEGSLFGAYDGLFPAIRAVGEMMESFDEGVSCEFDVTRSRILSRYRQESEENAEFAKLMGVDLPQTAEIFAYGKIRSAAKCRFLLYGNPFLLWMHHADKLSGAAGESALEVLDRASLVSTEEYQRDTVAFVRSLIEFTRLAERSRRFYAKGDVAGAIHALAPARTIFDHLENAAMRAHSRIGGSLADAARCRMAKRHVEEVIRRLREFGTGNLGYLPAFEILTHPKFMPHDQGAWWLVNSWANE